MQVYTYTILHRRSYTSDEKARVYRLIYTVAYYYYTVPTQALSFKARLFKALC